MATREVEADELPVDAEVLREEVSKKYREVAVEPGAEYHFHTGRPLARAAWVRYIGR